LLGSTSYFAMILTESRNHRTWRSEPNQSIYWRRGPDEYFGCQLPAEARTELLEEIPPPQTYRLREIPAYRPTQAPPPKVSLRPPPPVSPPRPPVTPGAARPAQSASRSGTGIWLLLGFLVLIGLLPQAISTLRTSSSRPMDDTQPQSRPVEVRRALPPPIEVRRALPAVPRALLVTAPVSTVSNAEWQPVRLLDGTTVQVCYQGELPSSAALPTRGRFIGEEWSTGNTSWIWMTPAGASFPSWVDP
jgi:hypothetical protein